MKRSANLFVVILISLVTVFVLLAMALFRRERVQVYTRNSAALVRSAAQVVMAFHSANGRLPRTLQEVNLGPRWEDAFGSPLEYYICTNEPSSFSIKSTGIKTGSNVFTFAIRGTNLTLIEVGTTRENR
jgi:hypothetical protein